MRGGLDTGALPVVNFNFRLFFHVDENRPCGESYNKTG